MDVFGNLSRPSVSAIKAAPGDSLLGNAIINQLAKISGRSSDEMVKAIQIATRRAVGRVSSDLRKALRTNIEQDTLGLAPKGPLTTVIENNPAPTSFRRGRSGRFGKLAPAIRYSMNPQLPISMVGWFNRGEFPTGDIAQMESTGSMTSRGAAYYAYLVQKGGYRQSLQTPNGVASERTRRYLGAIGWPWPRNKPITLPARPAVKIMLSRFNVAAEVEKATIQRVLKKVANG